MPHSHGKRRYYPCYFAQMRVDTDIMEPEKTYQPTILLSVFLEILMPMICKI